MELKKLVKEWFQKWEDGNFHTLPIAENFQHSSPFGTIKGRSEYLHLVETNKDKFLGYRFEIQDEIYGVDKACVRYTATQGDFRLEVSEWYYVKNDLIDASSAHYHIGEIRADRKLSTP